VDDGIVVVMTADEYLYHTRETTRPRELAHSVLREPPAPFFRHQAIVFRVARLLADATIGRGQLVIAPIDVVLDYARHLVVQPDVLFVSNERASIIQDQVWGAPDLVVEVLSPGTAAHDRTEKRGWYRQYGVQEYWLVDPRERQVTIVDFTGALPTEQIVQDGGTAPSTVPDLVIRTAEVFD